MTRSLLLLPLAACATGEMTTGEALEALDQTLRSDAGVEVTSDAVQISTDFTLGGAVEAAADELADFWASQAPCTEVGVSGTTVTVDYGTLDDPCAWNGKTYAGITAATVVSAADGDVDVAHEWSAFTDGFYQVDGEADVTWDPAALTHGVDTTHTWTELASGETVDVTGSHVVGTLDGDGFFEGGVTLEGERQWVTSAGDAWALVFTDVQARWIDPAPQAGAFTVTNPAGKKLELVFSRVDEVTIRADVTGARSPLAFEITAIGQVEQVD